MVYTALTPETNRRQHRCWWLFALVGGGSAVVWQLDGAPVAPFYSAIAGLAEAFDARTFVLLVGQLG